MSKLRDALHQAADQIADAIEGAPNHAPPPRGKTKKTPRATRTPMRPEGETDELTKAFIRRALREKGWKEVG